MTISNYTSVMPLFRTILLNIFLLTVVVVAQQKEIEVSTFYAKVYVAPSTNANFIGLIQKGERYPILGVKGTWYNIRFKNVNGWIEFSQAKVIDPTAVAVAGTDSTAPTTSGAAETVVNDTAGMAKQVSATIDTPRAATEPGIATVAAAPSGDSRTVAVASPTPRPQPRPGSQNRPSGGTSRPQERPENRIRSWFSQQNTTELPPVINPNSDQDEPILYFCANLPSPVRSYLDPSSPILGMTKRGQLFQLIGEGDSWCKIAFADSIGWVEKKQGKIVDPLATPPLDYVKIAFIVFFLVLLILIIIIVVKKGRNQQFADDNSTIGTKKHVVIIGRSMKTIQYTLTSGTTSLERCFSEVGFGVVFVKDGASLKLALQQHKPDIIMVDYQFDSSVITGVERICTAIGIADTVLVIVYNAPDPSLLHSGNILHNTMFLGINFSDRDVFKLITPLLRSSQGENIQKSVQASALAGNIGDGNLLEVLQFIEIGSKTGCLLVELDKPFAIICFKNGRINFAATADRIQGRDAIFKVLELKKGTFRFVLDKKPKASNVNLSTLEILMEWTKTLDEAHEH